MQKATMEGFYLAGRFAGLQQKPWKSDPTKFNYRIGIVRMYLDDFGVEQNDTIAVDVTQADYLNFQTNLSQYTDKQVLIRVVPRAGSYNGRGILNVSKPEGEPVKILEERKPSTAAA